MEETLHFFTITFFPHALAVLYSGMSIPTDRGMMMHRAVSVHKALCKFTHHHILHDFQLGGLGGEVAASCILGTLGLHELRLGTNQPHELDAGRRVVIRK